MGELLLAMGIVLFLFVCLLVGLWSLWSDRVSSKKDPLMNELCAAHKSLKNRYEELRDLFLQVTLENDELRKKNNDLSIDIENQCRLEVRYIREKTEALQQVEELKKKLRGDYIKHSCENGFHFFSWEELKCTRCNSIKPPLSSKGRP